MRDLNHRSDRQGHPTAGRNPPTGAAKKTAAKKVAAKRPAVGREPAVAATAVARRAAAIAALPAGSVPAVVTAIDFATGKPVKVIIPIIQGRNPPTGDQGGG